MLRLELLGRDLAELAEKLRRHVALRVVAQVLFWHLDARVRSVCSLSRYDHLAADVLLERDQVEAGDLPVRDLVPGEEAAPRAVAFCCSVLGYR